MRFEGKQKPCTAVEEKQSFTGFEIAFHARRNIHSWLFSILDKAFKGKL
jgi:hypothetical protein